MQCPRYVFHLYWPANGVTKTKGGTVCPLMNIVKRQLTSISSMLTHVGKLQLVKSILSSLPTFTMCYVSVLVVVLEDIDKTMRHCMWRNYDANAKSKPLVAWRKRQYQRRKEGLVLSIFEAKIWPFFSMLSNLDKFFNKQNIPYVTLIWNTYYSNGGLPQTEKEKNPFGGRDCSGFRQNKQVEQQFHVPL
jgi:hypothetical protein